jgi:hypothetical protein
MFLCIYLCVYTFVHVKSELREAYLIELDMDNVSAKITNFGITWKINSATVRTTEKKRKQ